MIRNRCPFTGTSVIEKIPWEREERRTQEDQAGNDGETEEKEEKEGGDGRLNSRPRQQEDSARTPGLKDKMKRLFHR